jgi:hypothetical protein
MRSALLNVLNKNAVYGNLPCSSFPSGVTLNPFNAEAEMNSRFVLFLLLPLLLPLKSVLGYRTPPTEGLTDPGAHNLGTEGLRNVEEHPPYASSWWSRLWPWSRPASDEPPVHVLVRPLWPDGVPAAAGSLLLPPARLAVEGLQADGEGYYTYNSSAMTPLVPWALSWMMDTARMANRSLHTRLDLNLARAVAEHVSTAYCDPPNLAAWNCSRCVGAVTREFELERLVVDETWQLQAFAGFSQDLGAIVLAFKGTDSHSYYNWVENMRTWRTDVAIGLKGAPQGAYVHGGFFYSYNSSFLAGNLTEATGALLKKHPSAPVFVAGHSLGGALATLCALDLRVRFGPDIDLRLVTFGSPRVGNYIFAQWLDAQVSIHWRFTHNRDIVPSVPPQYMGFYHVAREVWLVDDIIEGHTLVGVCNGSGEDPLCHNSVCHLGLCTSIADHMLYLAEMYTPRPDGC